MSSIILYIDNFEKIQKGIIWLKNEIEYSEEKIQRKKQELIDKHGEKSILIQGELDRLDTILELKCAPKYFLPIFVLSIFDDKIVENFKKCAENEKFWSYENLDAFMEGEDRLYFWNFLYEMGFSSNKYFKKYFDYFKKNVTEEGRFWNEIDQVCLLRLLISMEPKSPITQKVLNYCLENNFQLMDPLSSSIFILALTELNYSKFSKIINEGLEFIKNMQTQDGFWNKEESYKFEATFFSIKAICRVVGKNDDKINKAIHSFLNNQEPNGNWGNKFDTCYAMLSLLSVSPPFSITTEEFMFDKILHEQEMIFHKPYFIHTSPIYDEKKFVKEIYNKTREIFNNANETIRIISPYIDMLYEDIIDLKNNNPSLNIKIITRPKKDANKGLRERIAKNVLDILEIGTKGNLRTSEVIHSRLIIIDDKELIISSADLTREGLYDEFNAGIYTTDEDTIRNCIDYFENIWEIIKE